MGHKVNVDKVEVQKRELKGIFISMLETNARIMTFQLTLTNDTNEIKGLKRYIKETKKAIDIINSISHYEILVSLYNSFVNGKESYFVTLCRTITRKDTIVKWDRTEKGFKLFQELESQGRAESEKEYKEKMKQKEIIEKAKAEGKQVEMVYINGKLEPRIVESKAN